ncbi:integral membrane protein pth11-like protein [Colletotrichum karsti]|uniref:Integral membrane protein pth11-like protein n=1 Tax=Colletotrichum karsti TaxID=1095194 RepID=A0A9P6I9R2_9PEZI|nr:integral membrane protein pth11-like protein [Colletotrichum karsti]KAF9876561.1 integral membrane protein pth11-like protein [Colletotrichum karsti]
MAIDPNIVAIFGEAPADVDLNERSVVSHNIAVCVVLGVAAASVALRFYVRIFKGAKLWYDDYAIFLSVFLCGAATFMTILAGTYGAGEHVWSSNISRFVTLLKIVYAEPYVYATAVTSTKVSILLLYRRLFHSKNGLGRLYSIMYWTAVFLTSTYPPILWITMACACRPVSFYWTQYLGETGSCINVSLFFLLLGIVNMFNDIVILFVPVPRIWELQMNKRTKTSIIGIMLLGGFVCVASVVRIYYLNGLFQNIDVTWWMGPGFAWSSLEPSVAIISACLPTYAPLFRMGRNKSSKSSPYPYPSERSGGASGNGGARSQNARGTHPSGSGFGPNRSGGRSVVEDDEVELTCKVTCGDTTSSHGSEGKDSSDCERGIRVKTQVSVVSYTQDNGTTEKQ